MSKLKSLLSLSSYQASKLTLNQVFKCPDFQYLLTFLIFIIFIFCLAPNMSQAPGKLQYTTPVSNSFSSPPNVVPTVPYILKEISVTVNGQNYYFNYQN